MRSLVFILLFLQTFAASAEDTCTTSKIARANDDYSKISQATGGSVRYLDPQELAAAGVMEDLTFLGSDSRNESGIESGPVDIALFDKTLSDESNSFSFEVDPSIQKLYLHFSASQPSRLQILKPDGSLLVDGMPGVQFSRWSAGCTASLTLPPHGLWRISVSGKGSASFQVKGRSTIRLVDVQFVKRTLSREGEMWEKIAAPQRDEQAHLDVTIFGDDSLESSIALELRAFDGAVLQRVPLLSTETKWSYLTNPFRMEPQPVRAYLVATDKNGKHIERVHPQALIPSLSPDRDAIDEHGVTALMRAVQSNDIGKVAELLASGIDIDSTTIDGETALIFAVEKPSLPILRLLLERGASVNLQTRYHGTALFKAVVANNAEGVAVLLKFGAVANIRDGSGYTAYDWATKNQYQQILSLLEGVPHNAPSGQQ